MKVLLTTVDLAARGGIAGFYRLLQGKFHAEVHYCTVGSREEREPAGRVLLRSLTDTREYTRSLRNGGYDLVLINSSLTMRGALRDGALLLIARRYGVPALVYFHGWLDEFSERIRRRFGRLFRGVFRNAEGFLVLTNDVQRQLRQLGVRKPIYRVNTCADELFFENAEQCLSARRERAHRSRFVVLFLSRIDVLKGIYEAVTAHAILAAKYPEVRLVVAGDGAELQQVRAHVRDRGLAGVTFVGHLEGTAKLEAFREADAYLLPSRTEGMPLSVLEAMACGLPVITRSVGAMKDFFEDGVMGFSTESTEPAVLASLLERLVLDRQGALRMGEFNHRYAFEHFRVDAVVADLERIFSEAQNRHR